MNVSKNTAEDRQRGRQRHKQTQLASTPVQYRSSRAAYRMYTTHMQYIFTFPGRKPLVYRPSGQSLRINDKTGLDSDTNKNVTRNTQQSPILVMSWPAIPPDGAVWLVHILVLS